MAAEIKNLKDLKNTEYSLKNYLKKQKGFFYQLLWYWLL